MKTVPEPKIHVLICCIKYTCQLTHCAHQRRLVSLGGIQAAMALEASKNKEDGNQRERGWGPAGAAHIIWRVRGPVPS